MKVRFAPSPTGFLHIGGARTALFNWMYARAQKGVFVLRIEDTDQLRSSKEFEIEILESMRWLGLDWDELCYQSVRFDIYRQHAERLLNEGKAYRDGEAIILTMIQDQEINIYDLIRGQITFQSSELKDQVLIKSDGSPAYNFCCVVDDYMMEISHVIRGEDHISNTPKQLMIYQSLEWSPPKYAHLPLIMGEDGSRLSKRNGAVAVSDYRDQGFLPEALVNYLMLLGWSPGENQEILPLDAAVKKFSIKKVNKTAAIFSMDKLRWVNHQYCKKMPVEQLMEHVIPFFERKGYLQNAEDTESLKNIVALYKGRLSTMQHLIEWADYALTDNFEIDEALKNQPLENEYIVMLEKFAEKLSQLERFEVDDVEEVYRNLEKEETRLPQEMVHVLRGILTGKMVGPGIFEIILILGQRRTVDRLRNACRPKTGVKS
jgi:glutamyl-tRNA synthetase